MTRCSLCPKFRSPVLPSGPAQATVLLLGEQPARTEDQQGIPFSGPTGQELDQVYLPLAELPRDSVAVANGRMCSEKDYRNPTPEQTRSCAESHLAELLSRVKPKIVVPMGALTCSLWPQIRLNMDHGIPLPGSWGGWTGILFPMFHPSAGMHKTAYMIPLMQDFKNLGNLVRELEAGTFVWPSDPHPNPDYRVCRDPSSVIEYLCEEHPKEYEEHPVAEDTESLSTGEPYCLTFSNVPGTGRLIYARDTATLDCYRRISFGFRHRLYHNYLYDSEVFDRLGIPIGRFTDTMVRAYNLCLGGGGDEEEGGTHAARGSLSLKILAHRHLHMAMRSFQDTVFPHSLPYLLSWLRDAEALTVPVPPIPTCVCGHPKHRHGPRGKSEKFSNSGVCMVFPECQCYKYKDAKQPTDAEGNRLYRKISKLISDAEDGALILNDDAELERNPDLNPWKRVAGWHAHEHELLTDVIGHVPIPSIEHVPEPDLLRYAVSDADSTLRLFLFMRRLRPWLFY